MRRYQELIDHRLQGEINSIIGAFQNATGPEDIVRALAACPSLNMLNTRYLIYNPEQPPIRNPFADGNAWFVGGLRMVKNADEEIAALNTLNPLAEAVVDERFAEMVEGFTPALDSTATITLEAYRPNRLTYKTKADTEQLAVFSEIYYAPGWQATIDGQPADHFRADWILRAMRGDAGARWRAYDCLRVPPASLCDGGLRLFLQLVPDPADAGRRRGLDSLEASSGGSTGRR